MFATSGTKKLKVILTCLSVVCLVIAFSGAAFAQTASIKGKVVEEGTERPLIGTNVVIVGTGMGASTDRDGNYEILRVPPGTYSLEVSYIGYKAETRELTVVANRDMIENFELAIDVLGLDEVVVTGMWGTQLKEKLGVTIAVVKPEMIIKSDEVNVVQALAGKFPGVHVQETSGDPGTSSFIRIRGAASIDRGTQPLFVVDGIPISNRVDYSSGTNSGTESTNRAADINSEDIESIEILKGAAAAALYGSRASNGVVMITTKSGKPGKTRISYKLNVGRTTQSKFYPSQRWFGQGTKGEFRKNYSRSWGKPLNIPGAPHYDPSKPDDEVFDHGREISDVGWSNENNVTISGGNELTTFFLSFGRVYEKGHWVAGSDYERYTARLKGTQVITEKLKLTANFAYANTAAHYLQRGDNAIGLMLAALRAPPDWNNLPYIHPDTGFHRSYRNADALKLRQSRNFDNPFFIMYEHVNPRDVGRLYGYLRAEYDLNDWMKIEYTGGSDFSSDDALYVNPLSGSRAGGIGRMTRTNFLYHEIDGSFLATIQPDRWLQKLSDKLSGTLMLGHNINRREYSRFRTTGEDMAIYGFNQLDNTVSTNLGANEYQWLIHTESFFGQATLDLYDQLYLTGAMRNDGSSTFGVSERRHWYPKFSSAWEFTKNPLVPVIPYLDYGKLRFAYGEAGVQPGVYTTISGYSSGNLGFGSFFTDTGLSKSYRGKSGYTISSNVGTTNIKPERSKEFEFGADLALWNSRIGIDMTYYKQKSVDVIFDLNVVPSTGFFSGTKNAAEIENKGFETSITIAPVRKRNFSWDLNFIYGRNDNMVISLSGADFEGIGRWSYAGEGHELGEMRLLTWKRFGYGMKLADGTDIDNAYAGQWTKGDVYIPEDGYPIMDSTPIWSGLTDNPDWTGGISSEMTLFNTITISGFLDFVQGNYIMNHGAGALFSYGTHFGTADRGQTKKIPLTGKYGTGPDGRNDIKGIGPGAPGGVQKEVVLTESWYRAAGAGFQGDGFQFTEDASYVKLREISIGYTLRNDFITNLGLSDLNIRLSGRNLQTWTAYSGFDPDTNRQQSSSARDSDYFNQPQTRTYSLTLRINY